MKASRSSLAASFEMLQRIVLYGYLIAVVLLAYSLPAAGGPPGDPVCQIQAMRAVLQRPDRLRLQVKYYLSKQHAHAAFIAGYAPDETHAGSRFAYNPAGRLPAGIPKGWQDFSKRTEVEIVFVGSEDLTTSTVEVVIYDQRGTLCSKIFSWGQTWAPRFQKLLPVPLDRSLLVMNQEEGRMLDRDRDGLIDKQEGWLANALRPYSIFDSDEGARFAFEPVSKCGLWICGLP